MKELKVIVEYAGDNLSAYIEDAPIITTGADLDEIKRNIAEAIQLYLDYCSETGREPVEKLCGELNITYRIDAATFINYYSNIFTKSALSRITGINERQLWHYAAGVHKPRRRQLEKIQRGVSVLTKQLESITLL